MTVENVFLGTTFLENVFLDVVNEDVVFGNRFEFQRRPAHAKPDFN